MVNLMRSIKRNLTSTPQQLLWKYAYKANFIDFIGSSDPSLQGGSASACAVKL